MCLLAYLKSSCALKREHRCEREVALNVFRIEAVRALCLRGEAGSDLNPDSTFMIL